MAKLTIKTLSGPMTMPARTVGPFAIHRDVARPLCWSLSHTATGWAVATGLLLEDSADRIAAALLNAADWSFDNPDAITGWNRTRRERIRGLIRGMKRDDALRAEAAPVADGGSASG